MQPNSDIVIPVTSCLILLFKIDEPGLLKLPGRNIITTLQVSEEFKFTLPEWINIQKPPSGLYRKVSKLKLDRGETSVLALSLSINNSIVIIDDLKGRKAAERLNIRYSGTLGLILRAKQQGILPKVKPILKKIDETNFRIDKNLLIIIMNEAGE
jgi:predicted nucleic acid-binding protein